MSVWTDNAERFATRDREAAADLILTEAVREAVAAYAVGIRLQRRGHDGAFDDMPTSVAFQLCKAARSAERILR